MADPRFYQFNAYDADECDVEFHVVAENLGDAISLLAKMDLCDAVTVAGAEISEEDAAEIRTSDDENAGRDRLNKWPIGTVLSTEV